MTSETFLWRVAQPPTLAVIGDTRRAPVNRLFFVGRNYHAHALEMGRPVDKSVETPFYFTKSATAVTSSGATVPYPPRTADYQFEMELVVVIGRPGFRVAEADAHALVFGYACGLDMTRRDLQLAARDKGRPWDTGKDIEHGAVISAVAPMPGVALDQGEITLHVNGQVRQSSDVSRLIWNVRELIADLSTGYHLQPGDLIYTGTPEGVGPVVPGDHLVGRVAGVGEVSLRIGPPDPQASEPQP